MAESSELAKIKASNKGLVLSNLEDMRQVAAIILKSGFAPDGYDKPEQVFVALQSGSELGLPPIHALNSIAVINGKPSLYGDAALALVKSSGLLAEYSEKIEGEDEEMVAKVHSRRKGEDEITFSVDTEFSVADAKNAGLWMKKTKRGGNTPWVTHPKRMLKYKARAFNLRDNFPDVLMGLHITEELIGETIEPLPAPVCGTPGRGDVKPVDSTVKGAEPVDNMEYLAKIILGFWKYPEVMAALDGGKVAGSEQWLFDEWVTYILQCKREDISNDEDYTIYMLDKLKMALGQPLPDAIIDLIPKGKDE